jgi:hypothetical protein
MGVKIHRPKSSAASKRLDLPQSEIGFLKGLPGLGTGSQNTGFIHLTNRGRDPLKGRERYASTFPHLSFQGYI